MRIFSKLLILLSFSFALPLGMAEAASVKVAKFQVNGPDSADYLASAAQDAVVGALLQKGRQAAGLSKTLNPDKLDSVKDGGKETSLLVAGRIQVVGSTYRVLVKWVDDQGRVGQKYLSLSSLNELLPGLEKFAVNDLPKGSQPKLARPDPDLPEAKVSAPTPKPSPTPPPADIAKVEKPSPTSTYSDLPEAKDSQVQAQEARVSDTRSKIPPKVTKAEKKELSLRDYRFVSQRLPFEVRSIAYGDVNGDGQREVLLTSQSKLYLYSFQGDQLKLLAEYPGDKLDYFVKVDLLTSSPEGPLVVLTNLKTDRASSKLLKYSGGSFQPFVENIPHMLRVLRHGGREQLIGANYRAGTQLGKQAIFPLELQGKKLKSGDRIKLPFGTHIYSYDLVSGTSGPEKGVVVLSPEGKLRLYQEEAKDKYKKAWTSRESYGGTGNYVPVEVKDFFNEVVSDFYPIPVNVTSYEESGRPEVVVVKNSSLVKNVIGRVPIISHGQFFRLTYDQLGFVEAWASKKVDGSIQDYLVTSADGNPQLMAAVRLRDPGLFGEMGRNDSVVLLYDLK